MENNVDGNIDYGNYSFTELNEALLSVDAEQFPDRKKTLENLISEHPDNPQNKVSDGRKVKVNFLGEGKEYFNIWVVNILLTIVTLGIYSAWATVRTNRYFYSNTEIDGRRLSYLAKPLQILKGRVIAVVVLFAVSLLHTFNPFVGAIVFIVIMILSPLFICMSMRFRMRVTAYRNVTFDFHGRYGQALLNFLILPILSVFTLYLAMPWVMKRMDAFLLDNATYGDKKFTTTLDVKEYYVASIASFGIAIGLFIMFGILASVLGVSAAAMADMKTSADGFFGFITVLVLMIGYVSVLIVVKSFFETWIRNHVYSNTAIEDVCHFGSDLNTMDVILLRVTNFLLIVVTLGFAAPWVHVRTAKLFCAATSIDVLDGADSVIDHRAKSSALGEEMSDAFDFDVGIA